MKKLIWILISALMLTACGQTEGNAQEAIYVNINAQQAKEIMDSREGYVILDTRTQE